MPLYSQLPNDYMCQSNESNFDSSTYVHNFLMHAVPKRNLIEYGSELPNMRFTISKFIRHKRVKSRSKTPYISRKEKIKLNLLKSPKEGLTYDSLSELRTLWVDYIKDYLGLETDSIPTPEDKNWSTYCLLLSKVDFHGAELMVDRSKCASLVGMTGTCVLDMKNTFVIVGKDDKSRTIPKEHSIFKIILDNMELTIYGKHLTTRPHERSTKKVKSFMSLDL